MAENKKGNSVAGMFLAAAGFFTVLSAASTDDYRDQADYLGIEVDGLASKDTTEAMSVGGMLAMGAGACLLMRNKDKER